MANDEIKHAMSDLKQAVKRRVREAQARVAEAGDGHVNVAHRANIVVSENVGRSDAVQGTSARQRVRIRQDGQESYEETEETITRVEGGREA